MLSGGRDGEGTSGVLAVDVSTVVVELDGAFVAVVAEEIVDETVVETVVEFFGVDAAPL